MPTIDDLNLITNPSFTEGLTGWDELLAAGDPAEPPSDATPQPFLHYTSGTTGRPKGTQTPPTMFAGGDSIAHHIELVQQLAAARGGAGGVSMVVSPLYHTGPLGSVRALATGQSLVVLGRFNGENVLLVSADDRVAAYRVQLLR